MERGYFVLGLVVLAASCVPAAVGQGLGYQQVVQGATPVHYQVVNAVPAGHLSYEVAPARPTMEEVRKAVAGPSPGCSATSCSEITDGCGWCEKDGGYAVAYDKKVENLPDKKKKRTTITLKRECRGVFVYQASKCPAGSPPAPSKKTGAAVPPPPVTTPPPVARTVPQPAPTLAPAAPVQYYVATPLPAGLPAHHASLPSHTIVVGG